jgi:hypothetical protein
MKHVLLFLFVIVSCSSAIAGGKKPDMAAKETTISGEVVDVSCYLAHGAKGADHQSCAVSCAKAGGPVGIVSDKGKLYVSVMPDDHSGGPNEKLMDHIGKHVNVTGIVRSKAGVNGMMITKVEDTEETMGK